MLRSILLIMAMLIALPAHAIQIGDVNLGCKVTPILEPDFLNFSDINRTNNLLRKIGSAHRADGDYVLISGRVLDKDCMPISNAMVQIWQTDKAGKYYEEYILKKRWNQILDSDYDADFNYSGTAITDNLGNYKFVTILPKHREDRAPFVNFRVTHRKYGEIYTQMYFYGHPRNRIDETLQELEEQEIDIDVILAKSQKIDPTGQVEGRIFEFDITYDVESQYRSY